MARKYRSPILLDGPIPGGVESQMGNQQSIQELKDDISTSFVYGDDHYEEEYIVPDVVEEVITPEPVSEEAAE